MILKTNLPPFPAGEHGVGARPVVRVDVQRGPRELGSPQQHGVPRPHLFREQLEVILVQVFLKRETHFLWTLSQTRYVETFECMKSCLRIRATCNSNGVSVRNQDLSKEVHTATVAEHFRVCQICLVSFGKPNVEANARP